MDYDIIWSGEEANETMTETPAKASEVITIKI